MRIVGTAGHVDHGKSSLVISLTGHNPDRWVEERERGMTLDLGFAPLRFADGIEAGIIDVPGHERFIHNMLAGAAGIDVLLLVIDALEGPRAQTREHLQILGFLNVARSIVVLTKADLADAATLARAESAARAAIAGTVADGAPIIAVSNVTGAGIDALKSAIHDALADLPPRGSDAPAFLPVDRVFALQGHGTIVTGTLMQGTVRVGDTLALQPSGSQARIRSLQIFGRKVESAGPGTRLAVNIPSIDAASARRGFVLTAPREFEATSALSIEFTPLEEALPMLRRRTPVRAHIGAAEIEGRLHLDQRLASVRPVRATLTLIHPTVVYPGARLVLRRLSPKDLLGGAVVVKVLTADAGADAAAGDVAADDLAADALAADDAVADVVGRAKLGTDELACLAALDAARLSPLAARKAAGAANIREAASVAALDHLVANGRAVALSKPVEYVGRAAYESAFDRAEAALLARHASAPWRLGCSASEIATAVGVDDTLALRLLASWHDDGRVGHRARWWHLPDFAPALSKEQRAFFDDALKVDASSPLAPASYAAVMRAADDRRVAAARDAFESLVAAGALTRIGDDVYRRSQLERARETVELSLKDGGATTSQLRTALGISRKYALPLLEHFDSAGVTVRDGDIRRLRAAAGK